MANLNLSLTLVDGMKLVKCQGHQGYIPPWEDSVGRSQKKKHKPTFKVKLKKKMSSCSLIYNLKSRNLSEKVSGINECSKKQFQDTVQIMLKSPDHEIVPFTYHLHDTLLKLFKCVSDLKVIYAQSWCHTIWKHPIFYEKAHCHWLLIWSESPHSFNLNSRYIPFYCIVPASL